MGDRLAEALARLGLDAEGLVRVGRAYSEAIRWREEGEAALGSDHDPAFLHPGRTVLILADDVGVDRAGVLAAAALLESRDVELRVPDLEVAGWDDDARCLRAEVPAIRWAGGPGTEEADAALLEALVTSSVAVQQVALAEALDHIRHAHLWESPSDRVRAAEITRRVLAPVAERVDRTLARRYGWWERRVGSALSRADTTESGTPGLRG